MNLPRANGAVVVAMAAVRVVEVSGDEVVDVIPVGHRVVAAARPMRVSLRMTLAGVRRRARSRVRPIDGQGALVDVSVVRPVEVSVVRVVGVRAMGDRGMAASGSVHVGMVVVNRVAGHGSPRLG
jgi:hypothetical protein